MNKWSDHCDDVCAHCGEHTGNYAYTYSFNNAFQQCPHCGQYAYSDVGPDGVFRWFKTPESGERQMNEIIPARYYNGNGVATAIVAVVSYREDGSVFDWAAYVGGTTDTWSEDTAYEEVAERGCKLHRSDACYYFPDLPRARYRQ